MELKIGAAYVRVSTDGQVEYSPDSQLKLIRDYAKREGYIIPDEYVYQDDGISGKNAAKRPAFQLMIATAKQSPPAFDAIFVWKYSRFARNQEESLVYKNLLKKNGVAVKSISEPSNDDNPFASLIERILEWMDEYYLINLSAEVKRGMKEKSTRGEVMGKAPFGYRAENKVLVPDDNAPIVKYIYELYNSGISLREISARLEQQGVKTVKGKALNLYGVKYILRNPAYIGKTRWADEPNDGHKYLKSNYDPDVDSMPDGKHEAIISRELWDSVQKRFDGNPPEIKYVRKDNPIIFPLKGLVRCSACGATLTRTSRRNVPALQCYRYSRGQCNVSHSLNMERMEKIVIEALHEATDKDRFTFSPSTPPATPRLSQNWDKLISAEESRLKRAREAFLDGTFTKEEYTEAREYSELTITALKQQRDKENQTVENIAPKKYKERVLSAIEVFESPDYSSEAKSKALQSIIERIVYNKPHGTVDIFFRF